MYKAIVIRLLPTRSQAKLFGRISEQLVGRGTGDLHFRRNNFA